MNDNFLEKIKQELHSIPLQKWKSSPSHNLNDTTNIQWLPIMKIQNESYLGIADNGLWAKYSGTSVTVFETGIPLVFLLPCLEMNYDYFLESLKKELLTVGLSEKLSDTFPYSNLVYMGLTIGSEYWSELALAWAEKIPLDESLNHALNHTIKSGDTQKIRQKAKKILRLRQNIKHISG